MDLRNYGYSGDTELEDGLLPARIVEVRRERYRAVCAGNEVTAVLTGSFLKNIVERGDYPTVGDFVALRLNRSGPSGIVRVFPRTSKFSRTDFSGHAVQYVKTVLEQVVAANFDYVFILSSLNQDFSQARILRYLSQARHSGGTPVVVLSKADLVEDAAPQIELIREIAPDVDAFAISARTGAGFNRLLDYARPGKTIVLLGMSGVGKSSLINALAGENLMDVKEIREDDARGRHTTTHRQLLRLPSGAMLIDTPGMRELGLWDADAGISSSFSDVEELIGRCRFSDCAHETEPGCAVRAALQEKTLTEKRWQAYLAQRREARFVARKSGGKIRK